MGDWRLNGRSHSPFNHGNKFAIALLRVQSLDMSSGYSAKKTRLAHVDPSKDMTPSRALGIRNPYSRRVKGPAGQVSASGSQNGPFPARKRREEQQLPSAGFRPKLPQVVLRRTWALMFSAPSKRLQAMATIKSEGCLVKQRSLALTPPNPKRELTLHGSPERRSLNQVQALFGWVQEARISCVWSHPERGIGPWSDRTKAKTHVHP